MRFLSSILIAVAALVAPTQAADEIATLNYALTLEYLEADFYRQAIANYTAQNYIDAGFPGSTASYISLIGAHENAHVSALKATITSLGGTPAPACSSYPFGVSTVTNFLKLAKTIEGLGVSAYDGAVNTLSTPLLVQTGASIALTEARHAEFFTTLLNNNQPASTLAQGQQALSGFDVAYTTSSVVPAALPFLSNGCPSFTFIANVIPRPVVPGTNRATSTQTVTANDNDVNLLQYALTLEHLENSFYTYFVGQPNGAAGIYNVTSFDGNGYPANTFNYLQLIASHEAGHVTALKSTIGASAVVPCVYDWSSVTTPDQFIALAQAIEQLGASAYTGAANSATGNGLLQIAATIATVEARHSQVLNSLLSFKSPSSTVSPVNAAANGFESAKTPADVYKFVAVDSKLVKSCPTGTAFTLPITSTAVTDAAAAASSTGGSSTKNGAAVSNNNVSTSIIAVLFAAIAGLWMRQ